MVSFPQYQVFISTWVGKSLIQFNSNCISCPQLQLIDINGITALGCHHLKKSFVTYLFFYSTYSFYTGTLRIGTVIQSSCLIDNLRQTLILMRKSIGSCKHHITFQVYILLLTISRALPDIDFIKRFQDKTLFAIYNKTILQRERKCLGNDTIIHKSLGIDNSASYIHLDCRCCIGKSASLKDEVFKCCVVCIPIDSGVLYFPMNSHRIGVID